MYPGMKLKESKDGTIVEIYVKPNSQNFELVVEDNEIIVRCTEEPTKGKVNKELSKELGRVFHSRIKLVSGATSRAKRLLICGAKKEDVEGFLKTMAR